ncbi:PrsW family glutamic-type intramembrane protease [Alteribacter natronophilus]|uniref:PrsW family glutamic-type intramembrane protease n=1 Tax=Alteribacter natronophilus TaxID=2583810 RepID=UPI00110DD4F0|nr:PrsW family glutamic-type intramembrane protease [Alteribacter natronophilus]TMW72326.1 PrsW family intramembrane metalloprotease [Alteribacter natronophilus]
MDKWFYANEREIYGPYSEQEFLSLITTGKVTPETFVKREADTTWSPLKESGFSTEETAAVKEAEFSLPDSVGTVFRGAADKVNQMIGEKEQVDLRLSDVFSSVSKKHSKEEAELLFISGTAQTTPEEKNISSSWPKPWLFSRVFLYLALTYLLLYVCTFTFYNVNAIPGLIVIGAFAVPFSLLVFFWETNAPRNISIFEVVKMFFVGGVASIVATLFIFSLFPVYTLDFGGAVTVGVIEEVGKLLIVAFFIYKLNTKYILNGLLIGAAVGAGFAAFESAGYAFNIGLMFGESAMVENIFDRAWLSIGGHVVWAAITGAALTLVKGASTLTSEHIFNSRFLKIFAVPVALHAIWNMPLYTLEAFYFKYLVLVTIAWIFIFTLMNAGLKQITRLNEEIREEEKGKRSNASPD